MNVRTHAYISYVIPVWEKFGNIRNNLFVQAWVELLDHEPVNDPTLVECLC